MCTRIRAAALALMASRNTSRGCTSSVSSVPDAMRSTLISLRRVLTEEEAPDPEQQIARVLRFARFEGPTADIEDMLMEIERGRGLT